MRLTTKQDDTNRLLFELIYLLRQNSIETAELYPPNWLWEIDQKLKELKEQLDNPPYPPTPKQ